MKIAFYNIFGEKRNAEQETMLRMKYCIEKQGHTFLECNRQGYVTSEGEDFGKYIEDVCIDFLFTCNLFELGLNILPNKFSVYLHWVPLGFLANFQSLLAIQTFNLYDDFACFYDDNIFKDICEIPSLEHAYFAPSVPADFIIKPQRSMKKRLFYVGVNVERNIKSMRYGVLLSQLDKSDLLDIYGPKIVYGMENLWAGFQSYKGEIPFDGKSIIEKINKAGVCLALNSPMHNDANAVSNRIFEAAAAGAVIISDENQFVRNIFGDSVFYVNTKEKEEKTAQDILNILKWINENPNKAYAMACSSQKIFKDKLSLDKMIENLTSITKKHIQDINDITKQPELVDVVIYINSKEEFDQIQTQLLKQYYKKLHLIICSTENIYQDIYRNIHFDCSFVKTEADAKGESFNEVIKNLKGQYFMFLDAFSVLHDRHIHKNVEIISNFDCLFAYSGTYMKNLNGNYKILSNTPILRDEFLHFSHQSYLNFEAIDIQAFFIETIFSRACCIFKKEILDFVKEDELNYISNNIHHYLAVCSIIKANKLGRFTYALTSGYHASSLDEINSKVFASRKHWVDNARSAKTYIVEMNKIFFKYCFETTPNFIFNRVFEGYTFFSDLVKEISPQQNIISRREIYLEQLFRENRTCRKVMNFLTRKYKKQYPEKIERYIVYTRKHHLIRNIFCAIAKKIKKKI